jgi:hypothetical protein
MTGLVPPSLEVRDFSYAAEKYPEYPHGLGLWQIRILMHALSVLSAN